MQHELQREKKHIGVQQLQILRMIPRRCWQEAREIRGSMINTSEDEPVRHMIQTLPGAGTSELIEWICRAFEEVFGFQHGVHYRWTCVVQLLGHAHIIYIYI